MRFLSRGRPWPRSRVTTGTGSARFESRDCRNFRGSPWVGAAVLLTDIKDAEGETVADEIRRSGGDAAYLHLDVADEAAWQRAVDEALRRFGRLDILINNAGVGWGGPPEEETLEPPDCWIWPKKKGRTCW